MNSPHIFLFNNILVSHAFLNSNRKWKKYLVTLFRSRKYVSDEKGLGLFLLFGIITLHFYGFFVD